MDRRTCLTRLGAVCALALLAPAAFAKAKPKPVPVGPTAAQPVQLATLVTRSARCWVQAGLNIDAAHAQQTMANALRTFEQGFAAFRSRAGGMGQMEKALLVEQRWRIYRMSIAAKPDASAAKRLVSQSDDIARVLNEAAEALQKRMNNEAATLAQRGARGPLQVERMMRMALARRWDVAPADATVQLDGMRADYARWLKEMAAIPTEDNTFPGQVQLAQQQFVFLEGALRAAPDSKEAESVVKLGERVGEASEVVANRVVNAG